MIVILIVLILAVFADLIYRIIKDYGKNRDREPDKGAKEKTNRQINGRFGDS